MLETARIAVSKARIEEQDGIRLYDIRYIKERKIKMTILNCLIYATGVMVLIAIFSLLLASATFTAFDRIMRLKKKWS